MSDENVVVEQPRDRATGQFASKSDAELAQVTKELAAIRHEKPGEIRALEATEPEVTEHERYQAAHDKAERKKAEQERTYADYDALMKEEALSKAGFGDLSDSVPEDVWARNRNNQIAAGTEPRIESVEESVAAVDSEQSGEVPAEEAAEAQTLSPRDAILSTLHERNDAAFDAVNEAIADASVTGELEQYLPVLNEVVREFKGEELAQAVRNLRTPLFPDSAEGHARFQVAAYALRQVSNHRDVVKFLLTSPDILRNMQDAPPESIARAIHTISADLRFGPRNRDAGEQERPQQKAPKPKPPEPVAARSSTAFDVNDDNMDPNEWAAKRNADLRRRGKI